MLVTPAATINRQRSSATDWGIKRGWIGAKLQRVALPDALGETAGQKSGLISSGCPMAEPCGLSWAAAEAMGPETNGYFARGMGRDTVAGAKPSAGWLCAVAADYHR